MLFFNAAHFHYDMRSKERKDVQQDARRDAERRDMRYSAKALLFFDTRYARHRRATMPLRSSTKTPEHLFERFFR